MLNSHVQGFLWDSPPKSIIVSGSSWGLNRFPCSKLRSMCDFPRLRSISMMAIGIATAFSQRFCHSPPANNRRWVSPWHSNRWGLSFRTICLQRGTTRTRPAGRNRPIRQCCSKVWWCIKGEIRRNNWLWWRPNSWTWWAWPWCRCWTASIQCSTARWRQRTCCRGRWRR